MTSTVVPFRPRDAQSRLVYVMYDTKSASMVVMTIPDHWNSNDEVEFVAGPFMTVEEAWNYVYKLEEKKRGETVASIVTGTTLGALLMAAIIGGLFIIDALID